MVLQTNPAATDTVENAAERSATSAAEPGASTETAHGGGLPQFQFQHWGGQIAYMLVLFAILYLLISKVFAPRVRRVFDERESTIRDALSSARRVQAEADAQAKAAQAEVEDARAQARRLAADAKAKAQAEAAASQAAEDARLNAELEQAEARIRGLRDQAMSNVRGIAADTAEAIVAKLTGSAPSRAEVDNALAVRTSEGAA